MTLVLVVVVVIEYLGVVIEVEKEIVLIVVGRYFCLIRKPYFNIYPALYVHMDLSMNVCPACRFSTTQFACD